MTIIHANYNGLKCKFNNQTCKIMTHGQDYLFYEKGTMMTSKSPLKSYTVCTVATKNYVFLIPIESMGTFLIVNTFSKHQFFDGVSVPEGVKNLINNSNSAEELENSLKALLDEDDKYVYQISELSSFKFKGILGKHTLRMSRSKMHWASISPTGKGLSKEMRTYYGQ